MSFRVKRYVSYGTLALIVSICAYVAIIVAADWHLVWFVFAVEGVAFPMRLMFFVSLLLSPGAHIGMTSLYIMLATTILLGINVALMAYQIHRGALGGAKGILGTLIGGVAGLLGVGCAACGALFLSGLLAFGGFAGALGYFPLHGTEFAFFGLLFMALATFVLVREARRPLVC